MISDYLPPLSVPLSMGACSSIDDWRTPFLKRLRNYVCYIGQLCSQLERVVPDLQDLQMFKAVGSMKLQRLLPSERRLPPAEADSAEAVPPTVTATAALAAALPPRKTGSQAPLSDGGGVA